MDTNAWLWIAIIAFLIFCCLPMMFMRHRPHGGRDEDDAGDAGDANRKGAHDD